MIVKERVLRRYIRGLLLREARLLTELKDYADPKKSYGPESKLDQEKYDKIRADVLAKMKRFDQK